MSGKKNIREISGENTGESRLSRWSRRKEEVKDKDKAKDGAPEKEASVKRGSAAPVADAAVTDTYQDGLTAKGFVKPMPPLAEPEEGEMPYEAAPADALELLEVEPSMEEAGEASLKAFPIRAEDEGSDDDESRELTADEEEAVKDLPPIKSLKKDSDFTPFFASNVPDFLKRQAYKALWMSSPFFAFRDGLDDYDENFRIIDKLITAADSDYKPGKGYGLDDKKSGDGKKDDKAREGEEEGEGEDEEEEEVAEAGSPEPENEDENEDKKEGEGEEKSGVDGDDKKRKEPRPSDVRPPDNAVK